MSSEWILTEVLTPADVMKHEFNVKRKMINKIPTLNIMFSEWGL